MYTDRRPMGSTPEVWSETFASRLRAQDRLQRLRLARDQRWHEFRSRVPPGSSVLDAGSGTGEWVAFLASKGYKVQGLDFSEQLVAMAQKRYPHLRFTLGMVQDMPFADAEFDAVISWGVIEHDENGPGSALREFRRILAPGGQVFVTVPVDTEQMCRASVAMYGGSCAGENVFFQYHFAPSELAEALRAAGLESVSVTPSSRHFAPALPKLYASLSMFSPLARDLVGYALRPYVRLATGSLCMILGVGSAPSRQ